MRFFITLDIPIPNEQQIHYVQQQLKLIVPEARLTSPEKLHLTIAFIGNHPAEMKEPIIKIIKESTKDIPPFSLIPAEIDAFPHINNPRIIWIGLKGDVDKLIILQERIKAGLDKLQIVTDHRRYIPHIAIAKASNLIIYPETEEKLRTLMKMSFSPIEIHSIKLYESIPSSGFHIHNTLFEANLQPSAKISP